MLCECLMSSYRGSKNPTGQMHAREEINLSWGEKSCVGALQLLWLCSEIPPNVCSELSHREPASRDGVGRAGLLEQNHPAETIEEQMANADLL